MNYRCRQPVRSTGTTSPPWRTTTPSPCVTAPTTVRRSRYSSAWRLRLSNAPGGAAMTIS